jgi:hypothetical protein
MQFKFDSCVSPDFILSEAEVIMEEIRPAVAKIIQDIMNGLENNDTRNSCLSVGDLKAVHKETGKQVQVILAVACHYDHVPRATAFFGTPEQLKKLREKMLLDAELTGNIHGDPHLN